MGRPTENGMSEGAGFVNTALLEEEHDAINKPTFVAGVSERHSPILGRRV